MDLDIINSNLEKSLENSKYFSREEDAQEFCDAVNAAYQAGIDSTK